MTRRLALGAVVVGTGCIALAYVSAFLGGAGTWGAWSMVVGLALMVVALMALGASRRGTALGRLALPLACTFLILVGGFGAALALPPDEGPGSPLYFGLPLRAALVLYGIGLVPLFLLPLVYAWTFDEMTLSEDDLARVRALGRQHRAAMAGRERDEDRS